MKKVVPLLICFCFAVFFSSCGMSTSGKQADADTVQQDSLAEASVQLVPMLLLEKLGKVYGDNSSGVVGFSVDSKNCPDFIGGVYINRSGRLVIQIKGDSVAVREQLEEVLESKDFLVEPNLTYTQKELFEINDKLVEQWTKLQGTPVMRNATSAGVGTHDIEVRLIVNTPEKRREFREKVMDSPAFRFVGPETPVENATVGVNDIRGVSLQPEYTVYSTDTKQVTFILYNHSGGPIQYGLHYSVTYEDASGVWRELPINGNAVDIALGVGNGGYGDLTASLYPDVHPNLAGRYRFFSHVTLGDPPGGARLPMMVEFRLSDDEEELKRATKTPIPKVILGGLSEQEYREQEERLLETQVFTVAEQMPEFSGGGQPALAAFIADNISKDITKEGRAAVVFIVERDGSLSDIHIIRSSSDQELDDEAIRIIRKMPKWIPGKQRGKNVRVKYTIPVSFRKK